MTAEPSQSAGKADVREKGRYRDADQRVLLLHGSFGRGDVGTPLKKCRGNRKRNFWNIAGKQTWTDRELGGRPADQYCDCVLILRPL